MPLMSWLNHMIKVICRGTTSFLRAISFEIFIFFVDPSMIFFFAYPHPFYFCFTHFDKICFYWNDPLVTIFQNSMIIRSNWPYFGVDWSNGYNVLRHSVKSLQKKTSDSVLWFTQHALSVMWTGIEGNGHVKYSQVCLCQTNL